MKIPKFLSSSDDPERWSRTLKNAVPFAIIAGAWFGLDLDQALVENFSDALSKAGIALIGVYTATSTLHGAWRKLVNATKEKV